MQILNGELICTHEIQKKGKKKKKTNPSRKFPVFDATRKSGNYFQRNKTIHAQPDRLKEYHIESETH